MTVVSEGKREQVVKQCRVVAHLAKALADVHADYVTLLESGAPLPLDVVGARTARIMETLGDVLNGMDAADDDDDWTAPVFAEAQRLWPSEGEGDVDA